MITPVGKPTLLTGASVRPVHRRPNAIAGRRRHVEISARRARPSAAHRRAHADPELDAGRVGGRAIVRPGDGLGHTSSRAHDGCFAPTVSIRPPNPSPSIVARSRPRPGRPALLSALTPTSTSASNMRRRSAPAPGTRARWWVPDEVSSAASRSSGSTKPCSLTNGASQTSPPAQAASLGSALRPRRAARYARAALHEARQDDLLLANHVGHRLDVHRVYREQSQPRPTRPGLPSGAAPSGIPPPRPRAMSVNVDCVKDPRGAAAGHPFQAEQPDAEWAVPRAAVIPMPVALGEVAPRRRQRWTRGLSRTIGKSSKAKPFARPGAATITASSADPRTGGGVHGAGSRNLGGSRRNGSTVERGSRRATPGQRHRFGNLTRTVPAGAAAAVALSAVVRTRETCLARSLPRRLPPRLSAPSVIPHVKLTGYQRGPYIGGFRGQVERPPVERVSPVAKIRQTVMIRQDLIGRVAVG